VIKQQIGSQTFYLATVDSDRLKAITFVPVFEKGRNTPLQEEVSEPPEGYQRPGSGSRMKNFRDYLENKPNRVVPTVIVSSRERWTFTEGDGGFGTLTINKPAAIIDGQHRVGGYVKFYEMNEQVRPVMLIVLPGLSLEDETNVFMEVNSTQSPVKQSQLAFLGGMALDVDDDAKIAWALNTEPDSPFCGRITRLGMSRPHLFALHSVAKNVGRLFTEGAVADLSYREKIDYFKRYFTIIADARPEEWSDIEKLASDSGTKGRKDFEFKMLELTGLIAWSLCGAQIFHRHYQEGAGMDWEKVKQFVEAAGAIDWKKDGQWMGLTGEVGGKLIAQDMKRLFPVDGASQADE
jgi:DNA sulfur modification protein DndB